MCEGKYLYWRSPKASPALLAKLKRNSSPQESQNVAVTSANFDYSIVGYLEFILNDK